MTDPIISIKELVWILGVVGGLFGVWYRLKRHVDKNSDAIGAAVKDINKLSEFFKKVVLDSNGEIRLQDKQMCRQHRAEIQSVVKGNHKEIIDKQAEMEKKIDDIGENVLLLIYAGNIDLENKKIKIGRRDESS